MRRDESQGKPIRMDNHAQEFARQIISRLDDIKRLAHDAITFNQKEGYGTDQDSNTANDRKGYAESEGNNPHPKTDPSKTADNTPATSKPERFPQLVEWKPVAEWAGIVVLVIYTGVNVAIWFSSMAANRISSEALVAVQRPFVSIRAEGPSMADLKPGVNQDIPWKFVMENSGNTPARNARGYTGFGSCKDAALAGDDMTVLPEEIKIIRLTLGPKQQNTGVQYIPLSAFKALVENKSVYLWGWVTYRDSLDSSKLHLSEMCTLIRKFEYDQGSNNLTVATSSCRKYNCADEDCDNYDEFLRKPTYGTLKFLTPSK